MSANGTANGTNGLAHRGQIVRRLEDGDYTGVDPRVVVEQWVERQFEKTNRPIDRFALVHMHPTFGESRVAEFEVDGSGKGPTDFSDEILAAAQSDARVQKGPVRYAIASYSSDKRVERTFLSMMGAAGDVDDLLGPDLPPTGQGMVAQALSHNEVLFRLGVGSAAESLAALRAENRDLRAQVAKLMTMHISVLNTYELLRNEQAKRDRETHKQQVEERRMDRLGNMAESLGSVVFGKIMGTGSPEAAALTLQRLERIIGDAPPERLALLSQVFPDQADQVVLFSMVRELKDRRAAAVASGGKKDEPEPQEPTPEARHRGHPLEALGNVVDEVAALKASLSPAQRSSIRQIVGEAAWEAIGWASTAEQLADVTFDLGMETTQRMLVGGDDAEAKLKPDQLSTFVRLCKPRWEQRKEAVLAAAKAGDK